MQITINEELVATVKSELKRASKFIRINGGPGQIKNLPDTTTNRENKKLINKLSMYIDILGVEHPLESKVVHMRFIQGRSPTATAIALSYDISFIYAKQKEAIELIAQRFYNNQSRATNSGRNL